VKTSAPLPYLLLVESNTTGTGRQFAQRAAELGLLPVLLSADPDRYPYAAQDSLRTVVVDTSDDAALWTAVRALADEAPVAGVLSSSEYYVATAAALAERLGLAGPSPDAVRACRDKDRQRRTLAAAGVPVPGFAVAGDRAAAVAAAERIGFPVVVKPVQGSGSLGVRLCGSPAEVARHAGALLAATVNERGIATAPRVLVEQYLTGPEFSVEVFGTNALVTVAKHVGPLPTFVETGHDVPAALPGAPDRALRDCAVRAVRALGLGWGAAHVELRIEDGQAAVIEVNPRLAGGMIPELVRRALGVDLVLSQVLAAVGRTPQSAPHPRARAAIRFLTAERAGRLGDSPASALAVSRALAVPGVVDAVLYRPPGSPLDRAEDFRGRVGHVIAVSEAEAEGGSGVHAGTGQAAAAAVRGLAELAAAVAYPDPVPAVPAAPVVTAVPAARAGRQKEAVG